MQDISEPSAAASSCAKGSGNLQKALRESEKLPVAIRALGELMSMRNLGSNAYFDAPSDTYLFDLADLVCYAVLQLFEEIDQLHSGQQASEGGSLKPSPWRVDVEPQVVIKRLIDRLYQIRREYSHGSDAPDAPDSPMCHGGQFNALTDALNTVHADVNIKFVTPGHAAEVLMVKIKGYLRKAMRYLLKQGKDRVQECCSFIRSESDETETLFAKVLVLTGSLFPIHVMCSR